MVCSGREPLIIEDAAQHPLTSKLSITKEAGIGSFMAAPILLSNNVLFGNFCVFDKKKQTFSENELKTITKLVKYLTYTLDLEANIQKTEEELYIAQLVQESVLSSPFSNEKISFNAFYLPSKKLGGDMYVFQPVNDDEYIFFLMDVMGKGASSALISMAIRSAVQTIILEDYRPEFVIKELQERMATLFGQQKITSHYYFTCSYLVINTKKKSIKYSHAGHPPGFMINKNNDFWLFESTQPPIGGFFPNEVSSEEIYYSGENKMFFFTDGLLESIDLSVKVAVEELHKKVEKNYDHPNDLIVKMIEDKYIVGQPHDDVCMVAIHLK